MRIIVLTIGFLVITLLAGCASDSGINETGYSNKPLVDRSGNKLTDANARKVYRAAHEYLINGQPKKALRLYANIDARFPFSAFADQAALETITAHYRAIEYQPAIQAADQFIKQHPRSHHLDYVYYMRGLSNFKSNKNHFLGAPSDLRSIDHLVQAFSDFRILVRNYPNSDYAADARQHMIAIRDRVAKFNLRIASYYLDRQTYVAASQRAAKIIRKYQGAEAVPKALQIMQQSYTALNLPKLAADARAILQASYPQYVLYGYDFDNIPDNADKTSDDKQPKQSSS